jgi:heme/copper-type cytochrome/quinol oxidase subunit 2
LRQTFNTGIQKGAVGLLSKALALVSSASDIWHPTYSRNAKHKSIFVSYIAIIIIIIIIIVIIICFLFHKYCNINNNYNNNNNDFFIKALIIIIMNIIIIVFSTASSCKVSEIHISENCETI